MIQLTSSYPSHDFDVVPGTDYTVLISCPAGFSGAEVTIACLTSSGDAVTASGIDQPLTADYGFVITAASNKLRVSGASVANPISIEIHRAPA